MFIQTFSERSDPYFIAYTLPNKLELSEGGSTNERPGSDHVTSGPMRGLKKIDMKQGQTDRKKNI